MLNNQQTELQNLNAESNSRLKLAEEHVESMQQAMQRMNGKENKLLMTFKSCMHNAHCTHWKVAMFYCVCFSGKN